MLGNPQFSLLLSHSTTSDFAYCFFLFSGSLNRLFKDGFHIHSNFSFLLENNSEKKKKKSGGKRKKRSLNWCWWKVNPGFSCNRQGLFPAFSSGKPLVWVESAQGRGSTLAWVKGKKTEGKELGFKCLFKVFLMNVLLIHWSRLVFFGGFFFFLRCKERFPLTELLLFLTEFISSFFTFFHDQRDLWALNSDTHLEVDHKAPVREDESLQLFFSAARASLWPFVKTFAAACLQSKASCHYLL